MWKAEAHSEKDKSFQSPSSTYKQHWIDKETSVYVLLISPKLLQLLVLFKKLRISLHQKFSTDMSLKNRAGQGLQSSKNEQVFTSFHIDVFFQHYGSALKALEYDFDFYLSLFVTAPTNKFICFLVFYPDLEKFRNTDLQPVISTARACKNPAKVCSGTTKHFGRGLWPKELKLLNWC